MQLLRTENLVKSYHRKRVVSEVNIDVNEGEIVGLLGPNGAGKTTSFYMIVGLVRADFGKVFFKSKDVTLIPMSTRSRLGMGYLAQEPSIFRKLTVEENILAILEMLPLKRSERKKRLVELMDELELSPLANHKAYTLSGGERRRLEITRALVTRPSFLMLDEPFSGVDPIAVTDVQKILQGLKSKGLGILLTDHNVREALSVTDRTYLIYEGKVLKSGTSEFLANDPEARKLYLGEKFSM
ncbi:MAG: LPS export ABC transporter ATP-binding protein [Chlamydiae bacterium]|nr:LPS export ABC transporter ATP-binding protein [Chlamydiota bacterium]MBI3277485.1 LPS export ABC transporter ATP-binding protein [Chlamydiota bacterium]